MKDRRALQLGLVLFIYVVFGLHGGGRLIAVSRRHTLTGKEILIHALEVLVTGTGRALGRHLRLLDCYWGFNFTLKMQSALKLLLLRGPPLSLVLPLWLFNS